eukprot:TRINITY_DN732_c1_g1_i1.p1 TRINITY_DN732_c1_g1~~TRINITY_DN732_c1_g1_i1.p1  ORF type:complete len:353 (+),score=65.46 TRINITY_DN732_c1_g1_i1:49-1107(+)
MVGECFCIVLFTAICLATGGGYLMLSTAARGGLKLATAVCINGIVSCSEGEGTQEAKLFLNILQMNNAFGRNVGLGVSLDKTVQENREIVERGMQLLNPWNPVTMGHARQEPLGWFVPGTQPSEAPLLYYHGGGFTVGSSRGYTPSVIEFASNIEHKGDIFICEYPLLPDVDQEQLLEDAMKCYDRMRDAYPTMVVGGDSAGGTLTLLMHRELVRRGGSIPRAYLLISPSVDLTVGFMDETVTDPLLHKEIYNIFRSYFMEGMKEKGTKHYSALYWEDKEVFDALPPTWIWTGGIDPIGPPAVAFAAKHQTPTLSHTHQDHLCHIAPLFPSYIPEVRQALKVAATVLELSKN